jgi:hypothetical protein
VWPLHPPHGPPLSLDEQLRGPEESPLFLLVHILCAMLHVSVCLLHSCRLLHTRECGPQCTHIININYKTLNANQRLLAGICASTSFGLDVSLTLLLLFHLEHLSKNITTVEYHIKEIYDRVY